PTISVTSPYANKGNQSPSYIIPMNNSIPAIAMAASNTPYKPFQTMTDPNFIQLLVAFSKSSPSSQAGYLDDTDDQNKDDSPTSIDARVQQRLIQWGLQQKSSFIGSSKFPSHISTASTLNSSLSGSIRGTHSPNAMNITGKNEFQVPGL